ncbi:hypothetical protein PUN28_014810 [Cardiocondyla obscurior]|uniref:Uncharacterized protein n=1 Tax=Cardiocondyla obscurior TaxID=286306 RepID=A0AAW2EZD1_9HYME
MEKKKKESTRDNITTKINKEQLSTDNIGLTEKNDELADWRRAGERKEEEEHETKGSKVKPSLSPLLGGEIQSKSLLYSDSFIHQLGSHHALIILLS